MVTLQGESQADHLKIKQLSNQIAAFFVQILRFSTSDVNQDVNRKFV